MKERFFRSIKLPGPADWLAGAAALPLPLVTVMLMLNISATDAVDAATLVVLHWFYVPLGLVLVLLVYRGLLRHHDVLAFGLGSFAAVMGIEVLTMLLGLFVHRDYFSAFFMHIAAWSVLFLYWIDTTQASRINPEIRRGIGNVSFIVYILLSIWIMMMGYAIATRQEPRPIESLAYNAFNALAAFGILVFSRRLIVRSYRVIRLHDDIITVDGKPISDIIGDSGERILKAFLSSIDHRFTCRSLANLLHRSIKFEVQPTTCDSCLPDTAKASGCPTYRAIYNQVLKLKKTLEFLEIGTLVSPSNKRDVIATGWKLVLFQDVRSSIKTTQPGQPTR